MPCAQRDSILRLFFQVATTIADIEGCKPAHDGVPSVIMSLTAAPSVVVPSQGISQARDVAYGSLDVCNPVEYDGPYGVLLGERYTVIHSVATDGANEGVELVTSSRG